MPAGFGAVMVGINVAIVSVDETLGRKSYNGGKACR